MVFQRHIMFLNHCITIKGRNEVDLTSDLGAAIKAIYLWVHSQYWTLLQWIIEYVFIVLNTLLHFHAWSYEILCIDFFKAAKAKKKETLNKATQIITCTYAYINKCFDEPDCYFVLFEISNGTGNSSTKGRNYTSRFGQIVSCIRLCWASMQFAVP